MTAIEQRDRAAYLCAKAMWPELAGDREAILGRNLDYERLQTHFFGRDQHTPRAPRSQDALDLHFARQRCICTGKEVSLLNISTYPETPLPYWKARQA